LAPSARTARSFSSLETIAIERAPKALTTSIAAVPTPPAAPWTSTVSPASVPARCSASQAVE
jgi:hypothetical protein